MTGTFDEGPSVPLGEDDRPAAATTFSRSLQEIPLPGEMWAQPAKGLSAVSPAGRSFPSKGKAEAA